VFYRAVSIGIVLFWLVMTTLLVRVELFPDHSDLLPVPPAHVFKQMFLHEQVADLILMHQRQRLGNFHLQAKRSPAASPDRPVNSLIASGNFALSLPGQPSQRVTMRALLDLDEHQGVQHFEWVASLHDPKQPLVPSTGLSLEGWPARNEYRYKVRRGDWIEKEGYGSPEALLDDPDLRVLGIDPRALLAQAAQQQAASTQVSARRSSLSAHGETIETYLLTIRHAESLETTVQISQLGQVLQVKTFAGYDLYDEMFIP
jgi:hypothetical protein